ncbi:MAG: flagellar hook-associated protein FlgK [Pseudomonadota bacterium]
MNLTLTSALRIAQNSILNSGTRTSVLTNNIAGASDPNYSRRDAAITYGPSGEQTISVRRVENASLLNSSLRASASAVAQETLSSSVTRLSRLINGVDGETSISSALTNLENSLQLYSGDPGNEILASATIDSAREVADRLSTASGAVQLFRAEADRQMEQSVADINALLAEFKQVNDNVIAETRSGNDASQWLDRRDTLLKDLSTHIAVNPVVRDDNDMVLYTYQGVTLFETNPRAVTFSPTPTFDPSTSGALPRIDGIPLDIGSGASTNAAGSLAAWAQLRDDIAVDAQAQLDEIARGLVVAFAETDQTGGGAPTLAGLFTYDGGPAMPPAGAVYTGMAGSISVNNLYLPEVGGSALLLRDGGANGAAYVANSNGDSGFSAQLLNLTENFGAAYATDATAGIAGSYSLASYAEASLGWMEGIRSTASAAADRKSVLSERFEQQLLNETGVNMDEEMSRLIELEQSYEASARIIATVDQLFQTLLDSIR